MSGDTVSAYVCWEPTEDDAPETVHAISAVQAATIFTLMKQAAGYQHSNDWSPSCVLVIDYHSGDRTWHHVKVTVEASS